jgi:hypothetical protein
MMKNLTTKHVLLLPLVIASIFCTIYLNTQTLDVDGPDGQLQKTELFESEDLEGEENIKAPLLDVRIIKKVLDTGKRFIPTSN